MLDAVINLKDNFSNTLQRVENNVSGFSKTARIMGRDIQRTGQNVQNVGRTMTTVVTAPLVGIGAAAVKASIDFESAFAGVRKVVDATEAEFDVLEKGIVDMSNRLPQSAVEIAAVAEEAGKLGIEKENILAFTEVMVMMGDATDLSSTEAASSMARLSAITGMSEKDFDRLGSTIVALGNNFATTEPEILEMGLRLAGTANQVGMTEHAMMALSTAMSAVGITAERGGGSMSRVMQKINTEVLSAGKNLGGFAEIAGMTAEEFSEVWKAEPTRAILDFVEGLDAVRESGGDATAVLKELGINSSQEIDTMLRLSGASKELADALGISSEAWEENTALADEAAERYKTVKAQLEIARNNVVSAAMAIGEILVPYIVEAADKIKELAEQFRELDPETQEAIIKFAGIAAAAGPVLWIVGKITGVVGDAVFAFGKFAGSVGKLGLVGAIFTPGTKVVLILLAIAAAAYLVYTYWDEIVEAAGRAKEAIMDFLGITQEDIDGWKDSFVNAFNQLKEAFAPLKESLGELGESFGELFRSLKELWEKLAPIIGPIVKLIVEGYIKMLVEAIERMAEKITIVVDWISEKLSGFAEIFSGIAQIISGIVNGDWAAAWEGCKTVFNAATNPIQEKWTEIREDFSNPIEGTVDVTDNATGPLGKIKSKWQEIKEFFKNPIKGTIKVVSGWISGDADKNAQGTPYFQGGLTSVHERGGEIIDLPRGTRIYPHDKSVDMAREEGQSETNRSITVAKLADTIVVREEADIDRIASAMAMRIEMAAVNMA